MNRRSPRYRRTQKFFFVRGNTNPAAINCPAISTKLSHRQWPLRKSQAVGRLFELCPKSIFCPPVLVRADVEPGSIDDTDALLTDEKPPWPAAALKLE